MASIRLSFKEARTIWDLARTSREVLTIDDENIMTKLENFLIMSEYAETVTGPNVVECSCGCGTTKPANGRCECGMPLGH